MPLRQFTSGSNYRYGFNGKEDDDEVKGNGNQQDYGMRIYDTRLGRFLSVDPLTQSYPYYTPYQFTGNTPTRFIDLDGGEPGDYIREWQELFAEGNKVGLDPILGPVNVRYVYDNVTKQYWFVTQSNDQYYYWRHNKGASSNELINKNNITNGSWVRFKTYDQIHREIIYELVDNAGVFFYLNFSIAITTGGAGYVWAAEDALEELAGVSIPDGPVDLMKASSKREFKGGAYGELEGEAITGYQKHHLPADAISPLSRYKGGAIQIDPVDHKLTASYGSSISAKAYRAKQKELIEAGDFNGAFQMDINDIRSKFGSKYDGAIEEARGYYIKEGMIKE